MEINNAQKKTLGKIFKTPVPKDIKYIKVENLLRALGAEVVESRNGSRVGFFLNNVRITTHKPHGNRNELLPYQVLDFKEFLIKAGIEI